MNNLKPEQRTDKNGHLVTRHVRLGDAVSGGSRVAGLNAPLQSSELLQPQTREELAESPTDQDYEDAMKSVIYGLSWLDTFGSRTWDSVMGDKRRTTGNVEEYERLQREYIQDSPELMHSITTEADHLANRRSYGRAYLAGIETVDDEKLFEDMWNGTNSNGRSLEQQNAINAAHQKTKEDLLADRITPYKVLRWQGATKAGMTKWLEQQIEEGNSWIETRGRGIPANVIQVEGIKKAGRDLKATTFQSL